MAFPHRHRDRLDRRRRNDDVGVRYSGNRTPSDLNSDCIRIDADLASSRKIPLKVYFPSLVVGFEIIFQASNAILESVEGGNSKLLSLSRQKSHRLWLHHKHSDRLDLAASACSRKSRGEDYHHRGQRENADSGVPVSPQSAPSVIGQYFSD